jgi:hypothetical protein
MRRYIDNSEEKRRWNIFCFGSSFLRFFTHPIPVHSALTPPLPFPSQFTAGELSRADGVGFVFSQRLPCAELSDSFPWIRECSSCTAWRWQSCPVILCSSEQLRCQKYSKDSLDFCLVPRSSQNSLRRKKFLFLHDLVGSLSYGCHRSISVAKFACAPLQRLRGYVKDTQLCFCAFDVASEESARIYNS